MHLRSFIRIFWFLFLFSDTAMAEPISFTDILALPHGRASARLVYGNEADQYGDLWVPATPEPHRVIVLLHGGCWLSDLPGLELMTPMAEALMKDGYAVWNLEYRRIGSEGGGYPGTFQDVAKGIDTLRGLEKKYNLDLKRVMVMGHSAGGHLALWAASRPRLPVTSSLYEKNPLPVGSAISLAGINDLEAYRETGAAACGGVGTIDKLTTGNYDDTSPAKLLPLKIPQIIVAGGNDPIVPASLAKNYAAKARAAGDDADLHIIDDAGHFELIDPRSKAWAQIRGLIH